MDKKPKGICRYLISAFNLLIVVGMVVFAQVKCEIQSTVSRELEALRNREVWLLSQVDLLQNVKEEILSGQQAQINQALGSAHRVLQYITTDNTQLMEEISRNMTRSVLCKQLTGHVVTYPKNFTVYRFLLKVLY